jgi:membrane-associated phospholipid phosphatase
MAIETKLRKVAKGAARADAEVDEAVAPLRESLPVRALSFASDLGDQPQLRLLSSALIVFGLASWNRRLSSAGARMLIAHELATIAKGFVKDRVDRTRPRSARSAGQRKIRPGKSKAKEETSFPSGHTAGALAVARAFSREYPEHKAAALAAAGVIAAAQIPRCAHYVTDVAAGVLVGSSAEAAANVLWPLDDVDAAKPRKNQKEWS